MWIIELNIAGQRFTRQIADLPRQPFWSVRLNPRNVHWRVSPPRHSQAA